MARLLKVFGGIAIGGVVATADMTAGSAEAQMDPWRAGLQALLATERAGCDVADVLEMHAVFIHGSLRTWEVVRFGIERQVRPCGLQPSAPAV